MGCGGDPLPEWFPDYEEVRLDIDPKCKPHIVADMTDMGEIGGFDVVYSCHALEHLYPHQVPRAVAEFRRVLTDGGRAIIVVPDLEGVSPTDEVLFEVYGTGGITGLDLMYGYGPVLESMPYMAHHTGFVSETLRAMLAAYFRAVEVKRVKPYNLLAIAVK